MPYLSSDIYHSEVMTNSIFFLKIGQMSIKSKRLSTVTNRKILSHGIFMWSMKNVALTVKMLLTS